MSDVRRRSPKLVSPGGSPHNTPEHASLFRISVRSTAQATPSHDAVAKFTFGDAGGTGQCVWFDVTPAALLADLLHFDEFSDSEGGKEVTSLLKKGEHSTSSRFPLTSPVVDPMPVADSASRAVSESFTNVLSSAVGPSTHTDALATVAVATASKRRRHKKASQPTEEVGSAVAPLKTVGKLGASGDAEAVKARKKKAKKIKGSMFTFASEHPWVEDVDGRPQVASVPGPTVSDEIAAMIESLPAKTAPVEHAILPNRDVDVNPKLLKAGREFLSSSGDVKVTTLFCNTAFPAPHLDSANSWMQCEAWSNCWIPVDVPSHPQYQRAVYKPFTH